MPAGTDRMKWWTDARFGMFIHYGVYSLLNRGEWLMYSDKMPFDEYRPLADRFTADEFKPKEWATLARDAGMKYMVLTTRHHDGFCLFDSEVSDFTAPKTAAKRDLIAEYVTACRDAGLRVGFYYSLMDWRFPGMFPMRYKIPREEWSIYTPMVEQAHAQVRELMTNYGKIDVLWYDGCMPGNPEMWRSVELNAMARSLRPDIIINNRADTAEDFGTPENTISAEDRPWEACWTMNETWGGAGSDPNWKTPNQLLYLLASCVSQGGNLLLNIGPEGSGRFPREAVARLRIMGKWMKTNGVAIYGAGRSPEVTASSVGWTTKKGDTHYILALRWQGETMPFAWCKRRIVSARVLATGTEAHVRQEGDRVWLSGLPAYAPDPMISVIELKTE